MKNEVYQNDFTNLEGVVDGGCLYMSLLDIVSEEFKHELTRAKVCDIYRLCNDRGILGTWKDKNSDGAYVWDHKGVLEIASVVMGYKDAQWEYTARVYIDRLSSKNVIANPDYENLNCYMIFQVKTTAVSGHFKRFTYDPWKMGSKEISLISTRYYRRVPQCGNY